MSRDTASSSSMAIALVGIQIPPVHSTTLILAGSAMYREQGTLASGASLHRASPRNSGPRGDAGDPPRLDVNPGDDGACPEGGYGWLGLPG